MTRYERVRETAPWRGWMQPGRNMYAFISIAGSAFSVRPFARAHMVGTVRCCRCPRPRHT